MSDLNDLIATNAVRAYNEGVERGATEERERIIELLFDKKEDGYSWADLYSGCGCCSNLNDEELIALIKGEQK